MSLTLALVFHALVAGLGAYFSRGRLEGRAEWFGIPFLLVLAFTTLVGTPVTVFFLRFYTSWFLHYAVDPTRDAEFESASLMWSVAWMVALCAAVTVGFAAVRWGVARMNPPYSLLPLLPIALVGLVAVLLMGGRMMYVGAYEDYLAGALTPVYVHVTGGMSLALVVIGALTVRQCRRWFLVDTVSNSMPPMPTG